MLGDMKKREERNIEKIKQKQKNEIFGEIERNIKNKIIINKDNLRERRVQVLYERKKQQMQERAELEDLKQRTFEKNRIKLYKQKLEQFENL